MLAKGGAIAYVSMSEMVVKNGVSIGGWCRRRLELRWLIVCVRESEGELSEKRKKWVEKIRGKREKKKKKKKRKNRYSCFQELKSCFYNVFGISKINFWFDLSLIKS